MMLCFSGLERQIVLEQGCTTVLEVHNRTLFERICRSLHSGFGEGAVEQFTIFDDEGELVSTRNQFEYVSGPFDLPWNDRTFSSSLLKKVDGLLQEDPVTYDYLRDSARQIAKVISESALQMQSDYSFANEWELEKFLKAFAFGLDASADEPYFDNLIKFLSMAKDIGFQKVLVFTNSKLFLSKEEIFRVYESIFSSNLYVLMLETAEDSNEYPYERKYVIDQEFLEFYRVANS